MRRSDQTSGEWADLSDAIPAAQDGDELAFRFIYRTVHPSLVRYLRSLVGHDAEDVASETWLQIARGLGTFHGDGVRFRAWAATVGRHRALDLIRHERRRPAYAMTNDDLADHPSRYDTAEEAIGMLTTDKAIALIADLPRDQAEAVLLRVVMGLDARGAAQVLGKRPGAVRTAAYRGLRSLARQMPATAEAPSEAPSGAASGAASGAPGLAVPNPVDAGPVAANSVDAGQVAPNSVASNSVVSNSPVAHSPLTNAATANAAVANSPVTNAAVTHAAVTNSTVSNSTVSTRGMR